MLAVRLGKVGGLVGAKAGGLPIADQEQQIGGPQDRVGGLDLAEHAASDALLVAAIVDRELRRIAEFFDPPPQDANAKGVKGGNLRFFLASTPEPRTDPLLHLGGGLVGERDRENS